MSVLHKLVKEKSLNDLVAVDAFERNELLC